VNTTLPEPPACISAGLRTRQATPMPSREWSPLRLFQLDLVAQHVKIGQ
jgi:hypothetical protein